MRSLHSWIALSGLILLMPLQSAKYSELPVLNYISQYDDIAVSEMHRTGIPASIKLAQAIHESRYGTSRLSSEANNHFGIKCKDHWKGNKFFQKDDDRVNGKLVPSCFRVYDDAFQSFWDHSDFLLENARYQPLFELNPWDYKAWAKGLKACGYATDPRYAKILIQKIEKYKLYKYDRIQPTLAFDESLKPVLIPTNTQPKPQLIEYDEVPPASFVLPNHYDSKREKIKPKGSFIEDVFGTPSSTYLDAIEPRNK